MAHQENRLRPTDAAILEHLSEHGLDYPEVIAAGRSFGLDRVTRRADALADRGLVEPVSHEVVYRVTECGEDRLDAYRDAGLKATADD